MASVADLIALGYTLHTQPFNPDLSWRQVYAGDLLSVVLRSAKSADCLITVLANLNVLAVAVLLDIQVVIISECETLHSTLIDRANQESLVLLSTPKNSVEIILELERNHLL